MNQQNRKRSLTRSRPHRRPEEDEGAFDYKDDGSVLQKPDAPRKRGSVPFPRAKPHRFSRKMRMWMFRIGSIMVVVTLCAGVWLIMRSIIVRTSAPAATGLVSAASSALAYGGESAVSVPSEVVNPDALKGAAFMGNSCVDVLDNYGIIREATFFARTGLTVKEAFEKPTVNGKVPVLDELKQGRAYPKVFLLFGENELGWSTDSAFVDWYAKVIQSVHASQPKAKVYVQSILPVSKAVSDRNQNNTNNTRINQFNEMIRQICKEQNATYVDVHSQFAKPDGSLIDGISTDGIHFNKNGCQKWADYLRAHC